MFRKKSKTVQGAVKVLHNVLSDLEAAVQDADLNLAELHEEQIVLNTSVQSVAENQARGNRIIVKLTELLD